MNIYQKLQAVQDEIGVMKKDKTNPFFKSNYFDINTLLTELKPLLKKHKLLVMQPLGEKMGKAMLCTIVIDSECPDEARDVSRILEGQVILPENPDPQKMGSIITYFRRYALQSMFLLQAEDDDANKAVTKPKGQPF